MNISSSLQLSEKLIHRTQSITNAEFKTNEKLVSGLKINRSADDPSGSAISSNLSSLILSGKTITKGLLTGGDYAQVADNTLQNGIDLLQRARELALLSMNGTLSDTNRLQIQYEIEHIKKGLDDLAQNTSFNKTFPFDVPQTDIHTTDSEPFPESISKISDKLNNDISSFTHFNSSIATPYSSIPVGTENLQIKMKDSGDNDNLLIFTRDGTLVVGSKSFTGIKNYNTGELETVNVSDFANQIITEENGFYSTAVFNDSFTNESGTSTYNGSNISYSGDTDTIGGLSQDTETINIDTVNDTLLVFTTDLVGYLGSGLISAQWDSMPGDNPTQIINSNSTLEEQGVQFLAEFTPSGESSYIKIRKLPLSSSDLGLSNIDVTNISSSEVALTKIDEAINTTINNLAYIGSKQTALGVQFDRMNTELINKQSTYSNITDSDYSLLATKSLSLKIQKEAANAMLSHAINNNDLVLKLIN